MSGEGTMQAVWLENQQLSLRQDFPVPVPIEGEALIKVLLAGICATDLEMVRGYYPFTGILGHEFVGQIVQAPGNETRVGQRVVGEINLTCGECRHCRAGRASHCERRSTLGMRGHNGVFAEFCTLPIRNLHQVPDSVPDEAAVFTEPLAAALEIQQQIPIRPEERVLLIGAGRLGQLIAQCIVLTGCDFSVVVRHARHQQLLAQCGVKTVNEGDVGSQLWDIVIEATGSASGYNLARQAVRPRGTIVLKSTFAGNSEINLSALVVDEIQLVGSRCGPFAPALRLLEHKLAHPEFLISARYPLSDALAGFNHAAQSGILKIIFDVSDTAAAKAI
jgi:threonine dehydrogenase-like Zn-dependent dehydrogenase